jgi:hypothetical protein
VKGIASALSIIGVLTGAFIVLAPWIFRGSSTATAIYLMPLIIGIVVMTIHSLSFRRIRTGAGSRFGLLLLNVTLLALVLLASLYSPPSTASHSGTSLTMALQVAVYLLPPVSNVLYLALKSRSSGGIA